VGDRQNNRIQIFDQDGRFIVEWKQFGRPSGIFIDKNDVLYVADSESRGGEEGYGYNPGCRRGIRIGSAKDGAVKYFVPILLRLPLTPRHRKALQRILREISMGRNLQWM